jgi:hypothetical protein
VTGDRRKTRAVALSIGSNSVLIALKIFAGLVTGVGCDPDRGSAFLDRPACVDHRLLLAPQGG